MSPVEIIAFSSTKGGTGKTALLIAIAYAYAAKGKRVAALDFDFVGTSFADGLPLEAPDGNGGWCSLRETQLRRQEPTGENDVPFFERAIAGTAEFDPETWAWRHPKVTGIRWYPSSPRLSDEKGVLNGVLGAEPEQAMQRTEEVFRRLVEQPERPDLILCDLGPGLSGLPTIALRSADTMSKALNEAAPVGPRGRRAKQVDFKVFLVCTPDLNDLRRSVEVFAQMATHVYPARWILNRNQRPAEAVRKELRDWLPDRQRLAYVEVSLENFGYSQTLSRLYWDQDTQPPPEELDQLYQFVLRGAP